MTDKAKNVVLNFKMDGQIQYAKTLRDINAIMNTAAKEYKSHIAAMGEDASATDKLRAEKKKLEIQMDAAKQRTEMLRGQYDQMSKSTKTTAGQLAQMYSKLLDAENAERSLEKSMDRVNEGLSEQSIETRDAKDALERLKSESALLEAEQKNLTSSFNLQNAEMSENASESEKVELAQKQIRKQMELTDRAIENLEKQLVQTRKAYGENSREALELEAKLNNARTSVAKFKRSLDEVDDSSEKANRSMDGLGSGLQALAGALPVAAIAGLTESTKELSTELARLQSNAETWGFTGEKIEEAFKKVAAVSGDTGAAVETVSNLMATGFDDNQLAEAIEHVNGAYVQFSDTLSTEGIADGIQETFAVGEAAGSFAELLERSGMSLDKFNEGLTKAKKNGSETDYVLQTLSETGVRSFYESYQQSNKALIEANEAEVEHQMALKELGDTLRPLITDVTKFTTKIIEWANENPKLASGIATGTAALGVLVTVFATLTPAITGVIGAISGAGGLSVVLAALAGPAGWIALTIAGLAALGFGAYKLVEDLKQPSVQAKIFSEDISKSTQEAVGSFLDLNDKATVALNELSWSGQTVTGEMVTNISGLYDQMSQQILTNMQEGHAEQLATMKTFFDSSSALTEKEEVEIVEKMQASQEQQKQTVADGQARITEILNTAKNNKRSITDAERQEINSIQEQMVTQAVEYMTENEREQKVILERLKSEASKISAEQAAEVVNNSKKQKDEVVKEANDQYDKTIAEIIKQRDEAKTISDEQATKLIEAAQKQKNETVSNAEKMHQDVVKEAKGQAREHVDEVNWETGEIKSKWQIMKEDISERAGEIREDISKKWSEISRNSVAKWDEIKKWPGNKLDEAKADVNQKMDSIKEKIREVLREITGFFSNMKLKIPKIELPRMPKFNLQTSSKTIMGKEITYPTGFDVKWNAKGAIFTRPTIFGVYGGRLQGGGEAGPEAALPLNEENLGAIGRGIAKTMGFPSEIIVYSILDGQVIAESVSEIQYDRTIGNAMAKGISL